MHGLTTSDSPIARGESTKVLLVEDTSETARLLGTALARDGTGRFDLVHVRRLSDALERLGDEPYDVVLLVLLPPEPEVFNALHQISLRAPTVPIVGLAPSGDESLGFKAMRHGAQDFVTSAQLEGGFVGRTVRCAIERMRSGLCFWQQRYRQHLELSPEAVCIESHGRFVFANGAYTRLVGATKSDDLIGRGILDFVHPDSRETAEERFRDMTVEGPTALPVEVKLVRLDGGIVDVEVLASPIWYGVEPAAQVIARDITARKRAEEELRKSAARFRTTFEDAAIGIALLDVQGRAVVSNPALQNMLGYSGEELRQTVFTELSHRDDAAGDMYFYQELVAGERKGYQLEKRYVQREGHLLWGRVTVSRVKAADDDPLLAIAMVEDITERKRAELGLARSREQMRALSSRLLSIQEQERTRISREVHDELGQALTALKIDLAWLRQKLWGTSSLRTKTEQMLASVDSTIKAVRSIAAALRPGVLDLGLVAAIEWQLQEFQQRTGIECGLAIDGEEPVLDPARSTTVFRILQEALTNVARHAHATEIRVSLRHNRHALCLKVKDNGRGITRKEAADPNAVGLVGIRERALLWGGNARIRGIQGRGTVLAVCIPIGPQ